MKRVCCCILLFSLLLYGCGKSPRMSSDQSADRLNVVTTLFPYYDFVRQIAGGRVDLTMVIPAGMDSHSFEPTPEDVITIESADLLIRNGGTMEHWLDEVLESVGGVRGTTAVMMEYVDTVAEESVEGMEEDHDEHSHSRGSTQEELLRQGLEFEESNKDGHEVEIEYDEHIWTSPVNAIHIVDAITQSLSAADPENEEYYRQNADAYILRLKTLDQEFRQVARERKRNMIVVGDKFPFRYLADEYGFHYRAAFSGCSSDTEPSAHTIAYLIDKVRSEKIPAVYYLELSSHLVADIIGEETGAQPLLLHSCHNVTRSQFDGGITYLELMERNVENLRKGLDE